MIFSTNSVMSTELILVSENQTVAEADFLMKKYKIRHLPVTDSFNELSGILTSTDVAKTLNKKDLIKTAMNPRVRIIKQDASISKIIAQMLKFKISSMLVVHNEDVVGIVTTDDLIQLLYELIDEEDNKVVSDVSNLLDQEWDENNNDDLREINQNLEINP